jgi:D-arginine dehydrogenase
MVLKATSAAYWSTRLGLQGFDIIVIGGGIAGASAGYALANGGRRVLLLERESQAGYHSTGRSAAVYTQAYGNAVIRGLTLGGWRFFDTPPAGFADHPLLQPRGLMFIGHAEQVALLDDAAIEAGRLVSSIRRIGAKEARTRVPVLRESYVAGAILEPEARDIDVHGLHQGFLKGLKRAGGQVSNDAEVLSLERMGGDWLVETRAGTFRAEILVNAAGAWCDEVARLAGVEPVGLVPKRRTVITFDPPAGLTICDWPVVIDVAESFYFKPDAGKLLGSPADETPVEPCDVQPEERDVALAADRIERVADMKICRIERKWAGLRSFVADKSPVVGFDPVAEGFFWLAGQGGYGIQTSPALSRLVAGLVREGRIPADLEDLGVTIPALAPRRLRGQIAQSAE